MNLKVHSTSDLNFGGEGDGDNNKTKKKPTSTPPPTPSLSAILIATDHSKQLQETIFLHKHHD